MLAQSKKILLTGLPGCGKTTAVITIAQKLAAVKLAGFYTREIREHDRRLGFGWKRLDGPEGVLAHIGIKGRFKVGKYGVDIARFEKAVVPALDIEKNDAELFIVDEIGRMECLSEEFVTSVRRLFASDKAVLATVANKGGGYISEVKDYPGVRLFNLRRDRREETVSEILSLLSPQGPAQ
jgi:nucleoside-triphosphatase